MASVGSARVSETAKDLRPNGRFNARMLVGWAISILCLGLIAMNVDLAGAVTALTEFSWPYLILGLVGLSFGYLMRIVRWAVMLRSTGAKASARACAAPFLGSIALNNVLPLRAGDIVRATVFPAAIGVPRTAAIGSIVMERLLDLLTLVLFLAIGASVLRSVTLPSWLIEGAILLAVLGAVALMGIFLFSGVIARLLRGRAQKQAASSAVTKALGLAARLIEGFGHMSSPRPLASVAGLSVLVWLGEAAAFYCVIVGFGIDLPPIAGLLVMAFVTLSTLVPSSPGYVGPFHLAAYTVLVLLGSNEEVATSFAVLAHLMVWLPTTLAGGIAMLVQPQIFRIARAMPAAADTQKETHDFTDL